MRREYATVDADLPITACSGEDIGHALEKLSLVHSAECTGGWAMEAYAWATHRSPETHSAICINSPSGTPTEDTARRIDVQCARDVIVAAMAVDASQDVIVCGPAALDHYAAVMLAVLHLKHGGLVLAHLGAVLHHATALLFMLFDAQVVRSPFGAMLVCRNNRPENGAAVYKRLNCMGPELRFPATLYREVLRVIEASAAVSAEEVVAAINAALC